MSRLISAAFGAAFLLFGCPVWAEVYQAEGVASMEPGRVAAREAAIDDALRQVAITHQGRLVGTSQVQQYRQSAESLLVGPVRVPGKTTVVSESVRDGLLFVTIRHDTDATAEGDKAAGNSCQRNSMPPGRFLARRVVTSYFQVDKPMDAGDLGPLATWLPSELARRMNRLRDLQALDAGTLSVFPAGKLQEPWQAADNVREIGRREGVQFVLAGRVLDTAVTRREPRPALFGNSNDRSQGGYYLGPLAGLLGLSLRPAPVERRIEVEYWLFDALTGGIVQREVLQQTARGDVAPDSMKVFDIGAFPRSDYGQAVSRVMDELVKKAGDAMHCLPFSTRVARVDGERVYLSSGALDGLAVGDRLVVYKPSPATEIRRLDGAVLGVPERLAGDVEIEQVQPRFAVARLRNGAQKVDAGDWVRFPVRGN